MLWSQNGVLMNYWVPKRILILGILNRFRIEFKPKRICVNTLIQFGKLCNPHQDII